MDRGTVISYKVTIGGLILLGARNAPRRNDMLMILKIHI